MAAREVAKVKATGNISFSAAKAAVEAKKRASAPLMVPRQVTLRQTVSKATSRTTTEQTPKRKSSVSTDKHTQPHTAKDKNMNTQPHTAKDKSKNTTRTRTNNTTSAPEPPKTGARSSQQAPASEDPSTNAPRSFTQQPPAGRVSPKVAELSAAVFNLAVTGAANGTATEGMLADLANLILKFTGLQVPVSSLATLTGAPPPEQMHYE